MNRLDDETKKWIMELHSTGEFTSREIAEVVLGRRSRKSTVNDFLKSCNVVKGACEDIWDSAPEWATVIMDKSGATAYLESDIKGVAGRIQWCQQGFLGGVRHTSPSHNWHGEGNQAIVVARRVLAVPEVQEDAEETLRETHLLLEVNDAESGNTVFSHYDDALGDASISHVSEFAEVMMQAYKALGFQNKMTIKFKGVLGLGKFVCHPNEKDV
jgi:hypothetical protein